MSSSTVIFNALRNFASWLVNRSRSVVFVPLFLGSFLMLSSRRLNPIVASSTRKTS